MQWEMEMFLCYMTSMSHCDFGLYLLLNCVSPCGCGSPCGPSEDVELRSQTNSSV